MPINIQPKVLVTIPRMPFPLNSGGRIAIYDALTLLSKKYILTLVIIDDEKSNIRYLDEIKKITTNIHFITKNKFRFYVNSFFGLITGKPLQVGYFYFKDVQKLVNNLSSTHDLFLSFMIRTSLYGLKLKMAKIHYAIDSMYLNYKNSEINTTSCIWKLIYKIEIPLLYKIEKKHVFKYNMTTYVNKEEATFWNQFGNTSNLPHGVKMDILNYNQVDDKYKHSITFIGRMDYQPNIEAVLWFAKNVLSHLNNKIQFLVIGGFATPEIIRLEKEYKNIKILGFVEDPYVILKSSICNVAPMQSGGGLQTKILMSLAVESIVILSTLSSFAIEGIVSDLNAIIEDDPFKIAENINMIYENPEMFLNMRMEAGKLIKKYYSLDVIENKMFDILNNVIK
jgi:glycosyltransferase involved in cell wall biosynthesis